ncbi:MAG: VOC family protein [Acidimicrobiales bacterium]
MTPSERLDRLVINALPRVAIAVRDFEAAIATFRDVFSMPVRDLSASTVPDLGAHVGMCMPEGGSNIEIMAVADPGAPLSQSLNAFLDRRGEGLFATMLEAADPNAEAAELSERGLDVLPLMAGAAGRDIHPRSTHGVLIRVYPDNSVPYSGPHESGDPWLTGIQTVTIAVSDLDAAAAVYGKGIGLAVEPLLEDAERGVSVIRCLPPKGSAIELVSASEPATPYGAEVERFISERGPGLFSLTLGATDAEQAVATLADRGVDLAGGGNLFGTRIVIASQSNR